MSIMTKRYAVFSGMDYYAEGGWSDFVGVFDTLDEARACLPDDGRFSEGGWRSDWVQFVDLLHLVEVQGGVHDGCKWTLSDFRDPNEGL